MQNFTVYVGFAFVVGFTISIDIFFFTLAQASGKNLNWKNWTIPAAMAHVVLMGITVGLFYLLGSVAYLQLPMGILGAAINARYIYELTSDWRGTEIPFSMTNYLEKKFSRNVLLSWLNASVLAVSWDCIPVAAGIASETDTWTVPQLLLGLLVIGATVAATTQASLALASLVKWGGRDVSLSTKIFGVLVGNWAVLSLLTGFLILSITKSLELFFDGFVKLELYEAVAIGSILASGWFYRHCKLLWLQELVEVDRLKRLDSSKLDEEAPKDT